MFKETESKEKMKRLIPMRSWPGNLMSWLGRHEMNGVHGILRGIQHMLAVLYWPPTYYNSFKINWDFFWGGGSGGSPGLELNICLMSI